MHGMHYGSVPTAMLAVFKPVKGLISANMYGMCTICVVHRFLKRKVVVKHKHNFFGMKVRLTHVYMTVCVAKMMHGMHCSSPFTSMVAIFKPLKTISSNVHRMLSICVVD